MWTFDASNTIAPGDDEQNREGKWTYADGITRLARQLAAGLDIRYQTRVGRFEQDGAMFRLYDVEGALLGTFDALLLTPPAPQSAELVAVSMLFEAGKAAILDELARARYRRCLTLTLGYAALRERPYYALVNTDKRHDLSWLAFEHAKPARDTGGRAVIVAQLGPAASRHHWDDPLPELTTYVAGLLSTLLDEDLGSPLWADRQGWRYALPDAGADFDTLESCDPRRPFRRRLHRRQRSRPSRDRGGVASSITFDGARSVVDLKLTLCHLVTPSCTHPNKP